MNIPRIVITELIFEIEGLAPCSYSSTRKALSFIEHLDKINKIANIGCGPGSQSIILYEIMKSKIIAIDHRCEYIDNLQKELKMQKMDKYIIPLCCQLDSLPFNKNELDLIWAEFSANELGFKSALDCWTKYLKIGGYIAICAYCWNNECPPEDVTTFFCKSKIDIGSISSRIIQMIESGFVPTAHFILPEECWWNYFSPIDVFKSQVLQNHPNDLDVRLFFESVDYEIELFEKYGDSYEYVFFIGQKR